MKRRIWTEKEDEALRRMYADNEMEVICQVLGRTPASVYNRAHTFGLFKSQEFLSRMGRKWSESEGSKAARFVPGQKAWNKGLHYQPGGRGAETQFKKGRLPHNTKEDGVISIRKDKRGVPNKFIRVALRKWEYLSRHTWRQHNGPIPPGHCITFADGDTMNCDIENLLCISRKENMERNTIQRYPKEVKSIIFLTKKLKRIIHEKQDQ